MTVITRMSEPSIGVKRTIVGTQGVEMGKQYRMHNCPRGRAAEWV